MKVGIYILVGPGNTLPTINDPLQRIYYHEVEVPDPLPAPTVIGDVEEVTPQDRQRSARRKESDK